MFSLSLLRSDWVLRELHHLLWIEPRVNDGVQDQGWSCREHAWTTALLMHASGHTPYLFHGKAAFVSKRRANGNGLVLEQGKHTWVGIDPLGSFDLSIKRDALVDGTSMRLPMSYLFANRNYPDPKVGVAIATDDATYSQTVNGALKANRSAAVYLIRSGEALGPEILSRSAAWINSPLTDKFRDTYPDASELYCAIALHLLELLRDRRASLSKMSQQEAWDHLASVAASSSAELRDVLALG